MKKLLKRINPFSKKNVPQVKDIPVVITSYSQPHVLQQRMRENKMTHGETVTANLSPVRLEQAYGKMIMYFCPMEDLKVLQRLEPGDGGSLPITATVHGDFNIKEGFKPGLYNLENVKVTSNGTLQVHATKKTKITVC